MRTSPLLYLICVLVRDRRVSSVKRSSQARLLVPMGMADLSLVMQVVMIVDDDTSRKSSVREYIPSGVRKHGIVELIQTDEP